MPNFVAIPNSNQVKKQSGAQVEWEVTKASDPWLNCQQAVSEAESTISRLLDQLEACRVASQSLPQSDPDTMKYRDFVKGAWRFVNGQVSNATGQAMEIASRKKR